ncbi:MAG: YbhB/YbcL family Raf kinase inhibitor-like protein [Planctomycetaceae bacterium]
MNGGSIRRRPVQGGLPCRSDSPATPSSRTGRFPIGYRGPAPPPGHGTHHYHFRLYALDEALDLPPALDKNALLAAMQGHILAEGELVGTYER